MPQNAVRFGAKRTAIWCKTQCKMISKMYLIENKEVTLLYKLNR